MKLDTATQDVAVHGNFETSDFAVGDVAFIVDMFADKVYTHKERAIIRELSCNAHDSHVMAGTTDIPFKVHLPTALESWFSIRDYGTGLSDHEVRTIFAGIGISTKRDSNEVIGCFGIGSLSPYALTDSFAVKSYVDGMCRTYNCYRDENRKPVVALLTEMETDEPNGLEVSLTVDNRVSEFETEAEYVFRFWEGTLPDINNKHVVEACKSQRNDYFFKGDDFGLSNGYGSMFAVMGNIAYSIPSEIGGFSNIKGYIKFDLGELEFDTARENLSLTDKTKESVADKFKSVKEKLSEFAIQQIEDEPTPFKRALLAEKLDKGRLGTYVKGDLEQYDLPEPQEPVTYWSRHWNSTEKGRSDHMPVGENVKYYMYKDRMTTRIRSYLKDHNNLTMVILSPEQVDECGIDDEFIMDLDDLPKVARAGNTGGGCKLKTFKFDNHCYGYNRKNHWDAATLELDGTEIVYVEISRWEPKLYSHRALKNRISDLKKCGINVEVYGLKTAFLNTKAFKNGNFIEVTDFMSRELKSIAPSSSALYNSDQFNRLERICDHITSPELNEWQELVSSLDTTELEEVCKKYSIEMEEDDSLQGWMDEFFSKYEMLNLVKTYEIDRSTKSMVANYIGGEIK